jgi:hypothetical protein
VSNASGATIAGGDGGVLVNGAAGTVVNAGVILGTDYRGVVLKAGGSVTNETGGTIGGGYAGIKISGGTGTVTNYGTITGGGTEVAVGLYAGGQITNEAGALISGGVILKGAASDTLENAGTITAVGTAAYLGGTATNLLLLDPGAKFSGTVKANSTATNTIDLKSGSSIGTLSGLGVGYIGFGTIAVGTSAAWDISGKIAGFTGETITGFNSHDQLDLTNLTFSAGDTETFDSTSHILTIKNSSGDTLTSIQFDSSIGADTFKLLSDQHTGTFVEESDYTPCYLKGTQVRTPGGDRPVEALRIGDLVMTRDGQALSVKWIGRRSYRDWLAVGNEDAQPILFKTASIADGVPSRDLYVSPEHAMFIEGVLVPACHLVNGASVVKMEGVEEIDYFHLEFDRHVVIFAEDAPAESFVDDDSRMLFHNADEYRRLYSDEPRRVDAEFCAPRVEEGTRLDEIHRTLATRAAHLRAEGMAAPWGRRGKIEVTTSRLVAGWAFAGADAGPVPLAVLVNGAVVGRVVADRYRADLAAAGIGDGRHGFSFVLPKGLGPDVDHRIEVRREIDWSAL